MSFIIKLYTDEFYYVFAGVDSFVPASLTRYFLGWAVWEGAYDEAVGAVHEQIVTRAAGTTGAQNAEWRPLWPGTILIQVI